MRVSNKNYVRRYYPNARAEKRSTNGGKKYFLIRDGNAFMPMADGETESEAWGKVKEKIENQSVKDMGV